MKNQRIIRAYDSINPSPAEKQRMLDAILAEADLSDKPVKQKKARKEPIVYTGRPTKDSRGSILGGLAACIAAFLIGAFVLIGMSRNIEDPAYTQPDETMITGTAYDEILQKYKTALEENWTEDQCEIEDINIRFADTDYAKANAGYSIFDFTGDGRDELVIGKDDVVWDIYTLMEDGTPIHILRDDVNGEVERLYENGIFGTEWSGDNNRYSMEYCTWDSRTCSMGDSLYIARTEDNTWIYKNTADHDNGRNITEEEAREIMAQYKILSLNFTSFNSLQTEEFTGSVYEEILRKYQTALEQGWNRTMCISNNMSMLTPVESEYESLYYAISDLDSNGTQELVIAEYPYRENTDTNFLDIYTVLDNHVIQLMSLGDMSMRSLCEGGYVKDISTEQPDKYDHYVSYWRIEADQFVRDFAVYEMDGQWFTEGYRGVGAAITREEADDIVAAYPPLKLDFNPVSQTAETVSLTGYEAYDYIVNKYVTALSENWTSDQCEQNDISPNIFDDTTISYNLGWCLLDIDNNGVEELVISDSVSLFDLYTILPTDAGAAHVVMSHGGETWQLCENGVLQMHGLYSGTNAWRYYTLSDIDLQQRDMVFYEGSTNQYYYGANDNDLKPIDKNEVGDLIARDRTVELDLTPFVVPESFDPDEMEYYEPMLDIYRQAIREDWNPGQCAEKGISMMIGYYGEQYGELGYSLMDLDSNGIRELIITDGSEIFDLYTIIQDEETGPLHLICAMERQTYYLIKNMRIYCMGSGSAAVQYHTLHTLDGTDLTLLEGYMYDTDTWYFYDGNDQGDPCGSFDPQPIINDYMTLGIQNTKFE